MFKNIKKRIRRKIQCEKLKILQITFNSKNKIDSDKIDSFMRDNLTNLRINDSELISFVLNQDKHGNYYVTIWYFD